MINDDGIKREDNIMKERQLVSHRITAWFQSQRSTGLGLEMNSWKVFSLFVLFRYDY